MLQGILNSTHNNSKNLWSANSNSFQRLTSICIDIQSFTFPHLLLVCDVIDFFTKNVASLQVNVLTFDRR